MRTFGIEVEFGGDVRAVITAIHDAGLSASNTTHAYRGNHDTEWVVKLDGSVRGGGELVSPPLDFDDPEQRGQVERACAALRLAGARPVPSAGVHVHIGARDLNHRQIAAACRAFTKWEDAIYRLASSGWRTIRPGAVGRVGGDSSAYAMPLSTNQKNAMTKVRTEDQLRTAFGSNRYCGINLMSWFYRGTIEFRVFNSSVNADRIQFYIAMCMALVQDARNGKACSIASASKVGTMAAAGTAGSPERAAEEKKQWDNFGLFLRYRGGMALEDLARFRRFWADSVPQDAVPERARSW